jgi:hypothetical protein
VLEFDQLMKSDAWYPRQGAARGGKQTFDVGVASGKVAPKAADCGSRDGTDEVADQRSFADAELIVLAENSMVARAIHGIIALEDDPKRFASEPNA